MTESIHRKQLRGQIALGIHYLVVAVVFATPVIWMLLSAFKSSVDVTAYPPKFVFTPTLENFREIFTHWPFLDWLQNSVIITGGSTLLGLLLGVPAAYAAARYRIMWPAFVTLIARMAPGNLFLVPWYAVSIRLHVNDTYTALILTHTVITMPLVIWLMVGYFEDIPTDVIESAIIDGCSQYGVFHKIAVPLALPGLTVSTILSFVFSWNYFLFALILSGAGTKPLTIAAFNFIGEGVANWGALMGAASLISLPPILLILLAQRGLVRGLTFGAVKG